MLPCYVENTMDVSQDREQRGKEPPVQLGQSQTFISQCIIKIFGFGPFLVELWQFYKNDLEDNWKYLGDILSSDGKNDANIKARTYRGLGAITNIFQTLKDLCLGRYFYEAAMILRDSLLLRMRNMFYEELWEIMIIRVTGTSEDGEEVWPVSCSQPLSILW